MLCFFQSQESKSCNSFAKGFRCSIDNYKATIQKGECAAVDCGEEDDVLNAVGPLPQTMQPKTRTKMPMKMKTATSQQPRFGIPICSLFLLTMVPSRAEFGSV